MSFINKRDFQLPIKSACIYCGSSGDVSDHYKKTAHNVSEALAMRGINVVYGGGHVGLMGIVADAALGAGAKVVGIIPEHIRSKEVQHTGLTELHVVPDMHTRKRMMVERSDAFIILPGGLGTLDEAFEVLTWKKLSLHNKPIIIYNDNGFWDPLIKLIDHMVKEGFAQHRDLSLFTVVKSVDELVAVLEKTADTHASALTSRM